MTRYTVLLPEARISTNACKLCVDAVARQLQEQQLQARQLVLQQQAASAVAAASKTQREVTKLRTIVSDINMICSPLLYLYVCLCRYYGMP